VPRTIAVTVGSHTRDNLVIGVDEPTPVIAGALQPEGSLPTVISTSTTYSSNDQLITDTLFNHRVFLNAKRIRFENCIFRGSPTTPSDGSGLVECKNSVVEDIEFVDCEFYPQLPHWNWDSALVGHDFTALRCWFHHTTDGINVYNNTGTQTSGVYNPYQTNVLIQQCLIDQLAYWTATSSGVVHPGDIATHNDAIQHQGGLGTQLVGNAIKGSYARQYGHWLDVDPGGSEPYVGVALTSQAAGAPYYGGPFQAVSTGNTIPENSTTGTEATGRYNTGGVGSLAALMIGDEVGPTGDMIVDDNWFYGGDFCVNGGGARNADTPTGPTGLYDMTFRRNKFDQRQGQPVRSTSSNSTQTINFQQGEDTWVGHVTAPTTGGDANLNFNGTAITVRVA
jgi:hypothetical protein